MSRPHGGRVISYRRSRKEWLASLVNRLLRRKRPDYTYAGVLSPARLITDPDEAEALGLTADARRMRAERDADPDGYDQRVAELRATYEWLFRGEGR